MKRLILTCLVAFCAIAQREPAAASATGSNPATVAQNRWANEIAITPSQSRWEAWPRIREVNRTLAQVSAALPNVHFIPTAHAYLGPEGEPHEDLFLEDRLHLNSLGYRIWAAIIKLHLDAVLNQASVEKSRSTIE
jgi:lysophospholipase L1-like esterase